MNTDEIVRKAERLLNYPNTFGYDVEEDVLLVFVEQKLDESDLKEDQILPKEFCGLPVDVVEMEVPTANAQHRHVQKPLKGGVSIGPRTRNWSGTLGLVLDTSAYVFRFGNEKYWFPDSFAKQHSKFMDVFFEDLEEVNVKVGLTNEHVVDEGLVVQPSRPDGRTIRTIGEVFSIGDIDEQLIDFSVILLDEDEDVSESIYGLDWSGKYRRGVPKRGNPVIKSGRTTGITESKITQTRANVVVNFNRGRVLMKNVVGVDNREGFINGGDSGSAVLDGEGNLLGFAFASNRFTAYYIPMKSILTKYHYIFKDYEEVKNV